MNDPKNTALLVLLPSACRQEVISGARIGALGMKRKPRRGEEEETGECAAELEVMVMLVVVAVAVVVVITMFCSSSAPLSLPHTHTLSVSLSLFPSASPSRQRVPNNPPRTLAESPATAQARLSHPRMTSLHRRDNTSAEKALTAGENSNSGVELRGNRLFLRLGSKARTLIGGVHRPRCAMGPAPKLGRWSYVCQAASLFRMKA